MFYLKFLFYLIFLHLIIATPQLNLHYTEWVSENENIFLQHDCLRVTVNFREVYHDRQIVSYCMSELPSKFLIENNDFSPKFTFDELSKRNITSQQLFLWSTPIDLIERYQFYLNQLSTSNYSLLAKEIFYNCTIPRFGSMCQYELLYYHNLSLFEFIRDFQSIYKFQPTNFTCYIHLQCNRGPYPACLDWSEICDGKIDCLDNGLDEEDCWQLEINECQDNEYRCINGQCIPKLFYQDNYYITDCIDGSDESIVIDYETRQCYKYEQPLFGCDDLTCKHTYWTSSCVKNRENLLIEAMYSTRDNTLTDDCWSALKCLINFNCLSDNQNYKQIIQNTCPTILYFPSIPGLIGDIYFGYKKDDLQDLSTFPSASFYICYNKSDYNNYFINYSKTLFNEMICIHSQQFYPQLNPLAIEYKFLYEQNIEILLTNLKRYHLRFNYTPIICHRSNMYQCINSPKCISIHRLMDTIHDCPEMDDENINISLIEQLKNYRFKCQSSNKYIHLTLYKNYICDCKENESNYFCEDEDIPVKNYHRKNISFQTICDGFIDLLPMIIDGRNETDETECQQWPCNNIYTHCNDLWNCPYGKDEAGCITSSLLNCSSNYHLCISSITNQFICLPIEQANDGIVDCLGATDEPKLCQKTSTIYYYYNFYCIKKDSKRCIPKSYLCDGDKYCQYEEDEQFCRSNRTASLYEDVCTGTTHHERSDMEKFICNFMNIKIRHEKYFAFNGITEAFESPIVSFSHIINLSDEYKPRCHRGLDLRVWLNNKKNLTTNTCLCPPSFYGDRCQYQNQRISLALKIRTLSDSWQTLFAIVILLIDNSNERIIHSYEQFSFLSIRDCKIKFNIYLLYSIRPKNSIKNYAIHIDIYEKFSLTYRTSLLFPITFSFLPVHRLAFIIDIPSSDTADIQSCFSNLCIHGKCIRYINSLTNQTFCQCQQGWSGQYCSIQHTCMCSSDSLCLGVLTNNRSICICPMNKFGSQCLLTDTICQTDDNLTCENGGQCIPNDDKTITNQRFTCICPNGFSGNQCEIVDNKLILSFTNDIILSQSIFIHFIEIINMHTAPIRSTTFKTITVRQDSIIIYWLRPFHLVFIELLNKTYYLTIIQKISKQSSTIIKTINSSDRCPHISEILNKTIIQWHLIRRIKYYHLPCQQYSSNLQCFYDDIHICICYDFQGQRLANCLNFDHNMTFNCLGQTECENNGQCFQDTPDCSKRTICICPPCFYGRRCQFSTNVFGLSLDAILGYHILSHRNLANQPIIIKISLILTIIFILAGLINGILSFITFKNKNVREVGCGIYLFGSSITTLMTMIMFGLKFLFLLLIQMTIITNRSILQSQCISFDFILRICLHMDQWLSACVAVERAITTIKGARFDKKKSQQTAKYVIIILLIIVIGSSIHDPLYRRLIDEDNDDDNLKRIWCIVTYPSNLQVYNYIIHIFHFGSAFLINVISAIILIRKKSRQNATIHPHLTYREHLREEYRQHKHLLTAPIVLTIFALPRLIIVFISKCMKSSNDSWLYLLGYFISFIPSMLTFVVFIMPSKFYRREFNKSLRECRAGIHRHFHLIS